MVNEAAPARADTRTRILDAAVELIAEKGWGGVTTRGVADRAGANSALVHYYFGTKDALLREAALQAFAEEADEPTLRMFEAPNLDGLLRVAVEAIRDVDLRSTNVRASLEAFLRASRDEEIGRAIAELLEGYRGAIGDRIAADGARPDEDTRPLAVLLTALLDGLLLHRIVDPELDLEGVEETLRELVPGGSRR